LKISKSFLFIFLTNEPYECCYNYRNVLCGPRGDPKCSHLFEKGDVCALIGGYGQVLLLELVFRKTFWSRLFLLWVRSWIHYVLAPSVSCGGFALGLVYWGVMRMVFLLFDCRWVFLLGVLCLCCGFSFCSCLSAGGFLWFCYFFTWVLLVLK